MIKWTGLAPWEFEFPFPGSLTATFLVNGSNVPGIKWGLEERKAWLARQVKGYF